MDSQTSPNMWEQSETNKQIEKMEPRGHRNNTGTIKRFKKSTVFNIFRAKQGETASMKWQGIFSKIKKIKNDTLEIKNLKTKISVEGKIRKSDQFQWRVVQLSRVAGEKTGENETEGVS